MSQRLAAMRKLRENPNDVNALNAMHQAQNEVRRKERKYKFYKDSNVLWKFSFFFLLI